MPNRIVAISGAAGSLGPSVVRAFAAAGDTLAVAGRTREKLEQVLQAARVPEDRRLATAVDLGDPEAARSWAEAVRQRFGRVDVVLHLVGGYKAGGKLSELSVSDWKILHDMLFLTTLGVVRAFAGPLRDSGRGRFVGVSSPRAQAPTARSALYAAAKAASDALVLALADELKGTGSTANLVVVDSIDSPEARPGAQRKDARKATPAEQIAAAMLYFCSEEAASVNGTRLSLTGRA